MKAKQGFEYYLDKKLDIPVSHKDGEPKGHLVEIKVKRGDEIPKSIEKDILMFNKEFIELEYKDGKPVLPDHLKEVKAPPLIKKRKYTETKLHKVYEKFGLKGLKEIGATFKPSITDRSKQRLIFEILTAQERVRRTGK